ncbi:hypothetical protein [Leptospira biflexa]|uniref:hypothetical protein n=1 Tax=Leptospira biflexa TaxID=172 RepID=UPI00108406BC|nr:hypothetical protein [Leptospira biflexa]TGM35110.1 hypothetical protein EHQ89_11565 [Leptospira biflexa]TGM38455.1 hypothetical protein EHQ80_13045 [Leptospira biflexa]
MRKIHFLFPLLFVLLVQCSPEEEKGIIPGTNITGDPLTDALLLGVLSVPPCQFLTTQNVNAPVVVGEGGGSVCSTELLNGSLQVSTTGTYQISATAGKQTLSSSRCQSSYFDFHISLKEGSSELHSSVTPGMANVTLTVGTTYTLQASGIVDPNLYDCQGRSVTSTVTPYRINFRKL